MPGRIIISCAAAPVNGWGYCDANVCVRQADDELESHSVRTLVLPIGSNDDWLGRRLARTDRWLYTNIRRRTRAGSSSGSGCLHGTTRYARDLPWRKSRDPYRVWVSEIMLQQTRVAAVIAHYHEFLRRFPTVQKLAAAREASVLAAWSGLGYYRRARMLHAAAKRSCANTAENSRNFGGLRHCPVSAVIPRQRLPASHTASRSRSSTATSGAFCSGLRASRLPGEKLWKVAGELLGRIASRRFQPGHDGTGRNGLYAACAGMSGVSAHRTLCDARRTRSRERRRCASRNVRFITHLIPAMASVSGPASARCVVNGWDVGVARGRRHELPVASVVRSAPFDYGDRLHGACMARGRAGWSAREMDSDGSARAHRADGTGAKDPAEGGNLLSLPAMRSRLCNGRSLFTIIRATRPPGGDSLHPLCPLISSKI